MEAHTERERKANEHRRQERDAQAKRIGERDREKLKQLQTRTNSSYSSLEACFEGTRKAILNTLVAWVLQLQTLPEGQRLFWVHEVAGCGKSAVAASISILLEEKGLLAGTFFCKQNDDEWSDSSRVIDSLTY